MFAYRQGMLDSLCGIYCSINAVRLSISGISHLFPIVFADILK